jgi:hypothetical protein
MTLSSSRPPRNPRALRYLLRGGAPGKGRGRLQKGVQRVFAVYGDTLPASTIYAWCRRWPPNGKRPNRGERWSVVRILQRVAERVELVPGKGWLWRRKDNAAR